MTSMRLEDVPLSMLTTKCDKAESVDEAREIIKELEKAFMILPDCLGLAAPQIGILKTVGIIRDRQNGVSIDLINPEIVLEEESFVFKREGCMSLPGRKFNVPRFKKVKIENDVIWMPEGDRVAVPIPDPMAFESGGRFVRRQAAYCMHQEENVYGGLIAIAIQHEIDHLRGVIISEKEGSEEVPYVSAGVVRTEKKVGRNDKCPCGRKVDGKRVKYKKCCGR